MYIIDETFFTRELSIPNINELQANSFDSLESFVDEKCRLLLLNCLGYELFKDFDSNVSNGNLLSTAPQKWEDLVNGKEYTINGKLVRWQGLKQEQGVFKKSLLAYYVYYEWLNFEQSTMSGIGEVIIESKNAVSISSTQRLTNIWNKFLEMYQGTNETANFCLSYLHRNVPIIDWYNNYEDENINLIRFLQDNAMDYPNTKLKMYAVKNQLGL